MDSSGLAALLDVQREVAARGGRLAVLAPSQPVALLFDVAGVGAQLPVFASVEEALAA
jgi:anti-anti-sigma factor